MKSSNGSNRPRDTITIEGTTYDITDFKHPGGSIIKYMANGPDATDAFREFHSRSSDKVHKVLRSLPVVTDATDTDTATATATATATTKSAIDAATIAMTADFRDMRATLVAQGCFEPDYIHVYFRLLEAAFYFGLGTWLASYNIYASILSFVVFKTRCGWIQHEGGHVSLTSSRTIDRAIQSVAMGFSGGTSASVWNSMHSRHHAAPQKMEHDVDLDTTPLVAFFNRAFESTTRGQRAARYMNRWWMRLQAWTFLPIVNGILVHLFWLYYLHPKKVFQSLCHAKTTNERRNAIIESLAITAQHLSLPLIFYNGGASGGGIAWCYFLLMVTNFYSFIWLFGHFTLSHSYTGVIPADKHLLWFEYAVNHTVNISTKSALVTWIMGYLNFQIEHHLFPSMPQYKNALAAPYVRKFCERHPHSLRYTEHTYKEAWRRMLSNLNEVGKHYYENGVEAQTPASAQAHAPASSSASASSPEHEHLD